MGYVQPGQETVFHAFESLVLPLIAYWAERLADIEHKLGEALAAVF